MKSLPVKRIAVNALLLTLALIFSYVESLIPILFPIPGFKLGLANIVVMLVFYQSGELDCAVISFMRVVLISILFGNIPSLVFSLMGAVFSYFALVISKYPYDKQWITFIGVSVLCAAAHNIGQMSAAVFMFRSLAVITYLPWLLLLSVPTGIFNGFIMNLLGRYTSLLKLNK